jgi:hypothetical protein
VLKEKEMADLDKVSFDIFQANAKLGRENLLPFMVMDALQKLEGYELLDEDRLIRFLMKVKDTYREDVQYHNDLHGADVMQMGFYMLTTCGLQKILKLNILDCICFILAAACHDLGHDGFTNGYHVNAVTSRAIDSNDVSVQESFHAAELFRIAAKDENNFATTLSKEEFKIFRKRVLGLILATDMARHSADLSSLNNLIEDN